MKRVILIVEDNEMNRGMLRRILEGEYTVLEAEDGREALSVLHRKHQMISAVLMDIVMPVMDGFEVLQQIRSNAVLSQIPVIIATGASDEETEVKALALGANDFICKPYNLTLILHCLRNTIHLRENASIINAIQRDKLTGLYNRETFFEKADALIREHKSGSYVMSCFDIDNFKLINDQYGAVEGDRLLRHIGHAIREDITGIGGIGGRISADNFVLLYQNGERQIDFVTKMRDQRLIPKDAHAPVCFSVGRYIVTDKKIPASTLYDRAYIAKQSVKGRYDTHIAYFDDSMLEKLLRQQEIVNEMDAALEKKQFEVWFQPQFNHATGALIGAEALVRWRHPDRGTISPLEFIPVFENNGFVYEMDKYVWGEACRYLRKWIDEGRTPMPVSVNISRYDVFRADLIDVILGIINKYRISPDLLRLEITESAFTASSERIIQVVKQLMDLGFTLEIDDFGSGYSSLNTLKDVPANVLKLDMRFLESTANSQRGGNILESVVRMAKWLDMSVIAEGVETREQADFLKSIGCNYIQGYYYAKPMPVWEYEALAADIGKEQRLLALETVEHLDNNAFWDPSSMDTLIFNSYIGGACIFEYKRDRIEMLRVNDKYIRVIGSADFTVEDALKMDWSDYLDAENSHRLAEALEQSVETGEDTTVEFVFLRLPGCPEKTYLRSTMRVIASTGDRRLVYCTNENMTAQRQAEQNEKRAAEQLKVIMDDMGGGVTAVTLRDGYPTLLLANDKYYETLGFTRQQYHDEVTDVYALIHPEDRERVAKAAMEAYRSEAQTQIEYRINRRDGALRWARAILTGTRFTGVEQPVQLAIFSDITAEKDGEETLRATDEQLRFLNETAHDLLAQPDSSKGIENTLDKLLDYFGGARAYVFEFDFEKGVANNTYEVCRQDVTREKENLQNIPIEGMSYWVHAFDRKNYVDIPNVDELDADRGEEKATLLAQGIRSLIAVPLQRDGALVGFIGIDDPTRQHSRIDRLVALGDYITVMLTRRDLNAAVMFERNRLAGEQKELLDNLPCSAGSYEYDGKKITAVHLNKRYVEHTGQTIAELNSTPALELVHPDDRVGVMDEIDRAIREKRDISRDMRVCSRAGGDYRTFHLAGRAVARGNGKYAVYAVFTLVADEEELRESIERLRVSEEENRLALQHSGSVICRYHIGGSFLTTEYAASYTLPDRVDNVPTGQVEQGLISSGTADAYLRFFDGIRNGEKTGAVIFQQRGPDGGWCWLNGHFSTIFSGDGKPVSAVVSFHDITEQMEKEAVYKKWQQSMAEKAEASYTLYRCNLSKDASFDTVEGSLLTFRFNPGDMNFDNRVIDYAEQCVFEEDRDRYMTLLHGDRLLANYYRGKRSEMLEYREKLPEGGVRWLRLSVALIEYPNSTDVEAYLMYENIDDSKRAELLTLERAERDPLTGALNRTTFAARVDQAIRASRRDAQHALLMLDVDGFKLVNDAFGHGAGDQALIDIADALSGVLRKGDLLGRLGGDEFVMFLRDIPGDAVAAKKARQVCALVRRAYSAQVQISGSVGIVVSPRDGRDFEALYRKVDVALYHVKGSGKDNYALYQQSMDGARSLPEAKPVGVSSISPEVKKRRMLIVDDNAVDLKMLSAIFTKDFLIEKARDGSAALIRLRHYGTAISVVLLDLLMPGMDGFAVLKRMRECPDMQPIPVIVVSGAEDRETSLRSIRCGASDFVTKPVDPELLRIRVMSAVSKAENERLRIQNSLLKIESRELEKYRTVLEHTGTVLIENDWIAGTFAYDPSISEHLAGTWDDRRLWRILQSDLVADVSDVMVMQELVRELAEDRERMEAAMTVRLKTPRDGKHLFNMRVYRLANEYRLTDRLFITFQDTQRQTE